ncbi:MAG: hypothetical protein GY714_30675 [Desulfobacterales bacterium]|nr:hypothetical protein [Desulfobacterales bacterium]
MKYNLLSIFKDIAQIDLGELSPFGVDELWEWTLFNRKSSYLNETLNIHEWSGVPVEGRSTPLDQNMEIEGDYLLLDYIGHQPSINLRHLDTLMELAIEMLAPGGIFNVFTTIQIPVIKGRIPDMRALIMYKETDPDTIESERFFIDELQTIFTGLNQSNFNSLVSKARECVIKYKENGLEKDKAYNIVHGIKIVYQTLDFNDIEDLVDEVLDHISGYIGNKELWIYK